ncbi:hypothetical protein SSX86_011819 [Deinandra increscens subsp. villosa]|uniref:gibberellin 2beta-dioxygenase n=1 Tax=Deinandra increscens subsp. villosa TaxID=3103831 RepID=A0AAP0GY65_9ASTR
MFLQTSSPLRTKKTQAIGIPVIDLSLDPSTLSHHIIAACQDYGFFKLVNHGVPNRVISKMEEAVHGFFSKPASEKVKVKANPPSPFGYGCRNIGFNGDVGELEYILLQANSLSTGSETLNVVANQPTNFRCAVDDYIQAVKGLTSGLLEILALGLSLPDTSTFSRLIQDANSDSCFRVNHYPGIKPESNQPKPAHRIGFGEHSDPQIFTILRSNDVPGLQISTVDGLWIPVTTEPTDFCVFVGDVLEVLTNGRFKSVRHRVMANMSNRSRTSMMYFAAPSLNEWISPIPQMISPGNLRLYKSFTWNEYKKAAYSLRLGDQRIDHFKCDLSTIVIFNIRRTTRTHIHIIKEQEQHKIGSRKARKSRSGMKLGYEIHDLENHENHDLENQKNNKNSYHDLENHVPAFHGGEGGDRWGKAADGGGKRRAVGKAASGALGGGGGCS